MSAISSGRAGIIIALLTLIIIWFVSTRFEEWVRANPETRLQHITGYAFGIGMTALVIGFLIGSL